MNIYKKKTNKTTSFQKKYNILSYRNRGRKERVQITKKIITKTKKLFNKKKKFKSIIIYIKKPYSIKKMNLNNEDIYSILNPETNSVSLSKKSKGKRFISLKATRINK